MATDAVISVESLKNGRKTPEYLIFVKGDKFKDSWSLTKALEEFCGKNTQGFEMSYYAGIGPEEFETRFTDELSKINILFARNPEDLDALKKKFGVSGAKSLLPPDGTHVDFGDNFDDRAINESRRGEISNIALIIFIIIAAMAGVVYLFIFFPIGWALKSLIRLFKKAKNRQGT